LINEDIPHDVRFVITGIGIVALGSDARFGRFDATDIAHEELVSEVILEIWGLNRQPAVTQPVLLIDTFLAEIVSSGGKIVSSSLPKSYEAI
jgi:hypothetical protein